VVSRRGFLQALGGAALTLSAGGIALLDADPIVRTYFLPPRCGWNAGGWELACATEALRIVNAKLDGFVLPTTFPKDYPVLVMPEYGQRELDNLLARRARLVERVDKLARGWTPTRSHRVLYAADGTQFETTIHGALGRRG
jgi:hypothetical protein